MSLSQEKKRLLDKITTKPHWAPDAELTQRGWVHPVTKELLVSLRVPEWAWKEINTKSNKVIADAKEAVVDIKEEIKDIKEKVEELKEEVPETVKEAAKEEVKEEVKEAAKEEVKEEVKEAAKTSTNNRRRRGQ